VVVADIELVFGFWTTFGNLGADKSRTDINVILQILSVLKLLRVLRIFRLVVVLEELRLLMSAFGRSLQSISLIILTSILLFYIFGIFATRAFGCKTFSLNQLEANGQDVTNIVDMSQTPLGCQPHGKEYREWFGNIPRAMYSLFQIMTFESWSMGIVRVVMETWWYSAFFFIFFIGISSFGILNLLASEFVSKLLEVKEESMDKERQEKSNLQKIFQEKLEIFFDKMDKDGDEMISLEELERGVQELPDLKQLLIETGWMTEDLESARHMFDIMDVNDTGVVCFDEFIQLADVFGQDILKEHVYKAHSNLVRKLKKLEAVIFSMRETILPLIPDTKREAEMVRRTVKQLLKGCDSVFLENISLSSPIERVQSDAKAALSKHESNEDDSTPELKRSELVQIISDHAQRTVLWWTDDEPSPAD